MAVVNGYATLEQLVDWNGADQATDAIKLENAITAVSRGIDQYCQRHFWQTAPNTSRVFDTCDSWKLSLGPFNDMDTVTAVKTDDNLDGVFETTWSAADYQTLPLNAAAAPEPRPIRSIRAVAARTFPQRGRTDREGLIEVTGTWGWSAVPQSVQQACLIHASRIFKRKDSPEGVAGWGDFGAIRVGRTDPDVIALLDPYRLTAVLVA